MSSVPFSYNGIEIDMLSLGDADCIVVTHWTFSMPHRVLIDGGCGANYDEILGFLQSHGYTWFSAVVCTHCHNDHAAGLIRLVNNRNLTFLSAWMHDIRNHVSSDSLRRAASADDGVKQVLETTEELASVFRSRSICVREPFAGMSIAPFPTLTVLGPTEAYYKRVVAEFTNVRAPMSRFMPLSSSVAAMLGGAPVRAGIVGRIPSGSPNYLMPLASRATLMSGLLAASSVQTKPETQTFNNTSTILGMVHGGLRYMFTADAGSDALDQVPQEWNSLDWMQVPHHGSEDNLSQPNIERFCPKAAFVSAKGDTSHPSRIIANALMKCGGSVYSTHENGHLRRWYGTVPARSGYGAATPMKSTGGKNPFIPPTRRIVPI
ncbi:MAG TPA: MBL fold metallo-hydrolase [Terracidiphilus sp.]|nr:MBL fold metallo-hydrolase [Terracidiphilus sp.]